MARELGKIPLDLLNQTFDDFIYNLECVQLSCEEEAKQMEKARSDAKRGDSGKQIDFDSWAEQVRVLNAQGVKEKKYGIKSH